MDNREAPEENFLCFQTMERYFLLPLDEVVQIVSNDEDKTDKDSEFSLKAYPDLLLLDFRTGEAEISDLSHATTIVLRGGASVFGLIVTSVYGIIHIQPKCQYELPVTVQTEHNQYLQGVSYWEEEQQLCFLLSAQQLSSYLEIRGDMT